VRAGHFILRQGDHVQWQPAASFEDTDAKAIRNAFVVGRERTPAQDLEYGVRQLVEIAVRSLSAGINDPFTAIAVLDTLGEAIEAILARGAQPQVLRDESGTVRVVADRTDT